MSQLRQKLGEAAGRNSALLAILNDSDYAVPALKQNTPYIADLTSQIEATEKKLRGLHFTTEKERREHVMVRHSVVRRYASKLKGHKGQESFSARQDKEEREFLEAWQQECAAEDRRDELKSALDQAEKERESLKPDVASHNEAQRELDQVYQSLFSGPTPEIPGEDDLELALEQNRSFYQECQQQSGREKKAAEMLDQVKLRLVKANDEMLEALNYSDLVRLGGSRSKWDYEARYARYRARLNYHASSQLMADAKRAQPAIAPLREVAIDHSHELGDIVFENIFTNTLQHKMIQQSTLQMQQASEPLEGIIAEQKKRVHEAQWRETQASSQLEDARLELQKIRSEAFERLAGEGGYDPVGEGAELPPYTA